MTHAEKDALLTWFRSAAINDDKEQLETAVQAMDLLEELTTLRTVRRQHFQKAKSSDPADKKQHEIMLRAIEDKITEDEEKLKGLNKPWSVRSSF